MRFESRQDADMLLVNVVERDVLVLAHAQL